MTSVLNPKTRSSQATFVLHSLWYDPHSPRYLFAHHEPSLRTPPLCHFSRFSCFWHVQGPRWSGPHIQHCSRALCTYAHHRKQNLSVSVPTHLGMPISPVPRRFLATLTPHALCTWIRITGTCTHIQAVHTLPGYHAAVSHAGSDSD